MLCGGCGGRFTKIMLVEQTVDSAITSAFTVQECFASSLNHEYECPYCPKKAEIILSELMLVGDT